MGAPFVFIVCCPDGTLYQKEKQGGAHFYSWGQYSSSGIMSIVLPRFSPCFWGKKFPAGLLID